VEKVPKLPDPSGSLSMEILSFSIVLANAVVKSMLAEELIGNERVGWNYFFAEALTYETTVRTCVCTYTY